MGLSAGADKDHTGYTLHVWFRNERGLFKVHGSRKRINDLVDLNSARAEDDPETLQLDNALCVI